MTSTALILACIGDRPVTSLDVCRKTGLPNKTVSPTLNSLASRKAVWRCEKRLLLDGHWLPLYVSQDSEVARREKRGLFHDPDLIAPAFNDWLRTA